MTSIYDELSGKIAEAPGLRKRNNARSDLGLLLFAARDDCRDLWKAAERCSALLAAGGEDAAGLRAALEKLRPLFGERAG